MHHYASEHILYLLILVYHRMKVWIGPAQILKSLWLFLEDMDKFDHNTVSISVDVDM